MSLNNVEIVRASFEAWNAGDMDAFRELYDPDVIVRTAEGWPEPGPYVGREAFMAWVEQLRKTWGADTAEPISDFMDLADHVVVRMVWHGAGRGPAANIEFTIVYTVRKGRDLRPAVRLGSRRGPRGRRAAGVGVRVSPEASSRWKSPRARAAAPALWKKGGYFLGLDIGGDLPSSRTESWRRGLRGTRSGSYETAPLEWGRFVVPLWYRPMRPFCPQRPPAWKKRTIWTLADASTIAELGDEIAQAESQGG